MRILLCLILSLSLYGTTLHLATSSNPARINPILATDSASSQIADFIFNGLVKYDKNVSNIVGDLATSYRFENNTTLVFELRKDVTWHDGAPFSAEDVVFTYELINAPQIVSPYTSTFRVVKSVEALDRYRVKVVYKEPYFKAIEAWMMGILPKHLLQDETDMMGSSFNTNPIGTGPYRLGKLEFSKQIELQAYDDYFIHRPKIDTIMFHVIPDPMTRFLMLKSGDLDIGSLEAMQFERQVEPEFFKHFNTIEKIRFAYDYLGFNLRLEKFQDARVRRALSLAIDRQSLVDILFLGHGQVCTGPFLPDGPSFNESVKVPKRNLEEAKALLNAAGYDDENPLSFEIVTSNSNMIRSYAAQIIQHQLEDIGVKVTLRVMEWQAFLNMVVFPRAFDAVLLGWSLPIAPDPYLVWHSDSDKPGGFNFISYQNDVLDGMIDRMQYTVDRDALAALQQQIFASIVTDDPYLFLYIPNAITVVNRRIKNIEPALGGIWHNVIEWEKSDK